MKKKRNYIFTNRRHSERAIMATILGIISCVALNAAVFLTYLQGGNAPAGYGMTGFLAAIFSLTGLLLGIVTVQNKHYYPFFPWLAILLNLVALGETALVLYFAR